MTSELLECIRISIEKGDAKANELAESIGMTPQAFYEFVHNCKGTQIARAEQILDVLGYEIVLRRRKEKK